MELRNRLESSLGLTLSATLVWTHPNVAAISNFLGQQLFESQSTAPKPDSEPQVQPELGGMTADEVAKTSERLSSLSDEELASLVSKSLPEEML
jgi:hypothetical protein